MTPGFATDNPLINGLQRPEAYDHAVREISIIETHISWVILTGEYAYKIKKSVALDFLDFSTLLLRAHYCREEVRLNRRLAPDLYIEAVTIGGTVDKPRIGTTPVLEYAVKMRQFDPDALALNALQQGTLLASQLTSLAHRLAAFHREARKSPPDTAYGGAEMISTQAKDNIRALQTKPTLTSNGQLYLNWLEQWSCRQITSLQTFWDQRRRDGYVREGHGDLHLGNIAILDHELVPFDALEFSEPLRYIDVISDLSFIYMDLCYHGARNSGSWLLNHYLDYSGDYSALTSLSFYTVYRALVRAKVSHLRAAQFADRKGIEFDRAMASVERHLDFAFHYTKQTPAFLLIMCGLSGSGKSTVATELASLLDAIWVRSDTVRKRRARPSPADQGSSELNEGIYTLENTRATYQEMTTIARTLLTQNYAVVLDATALRVDQRRLFVGLAQKMKLPFRIIQCVAPADILKSRIITRYNQRLDASEATAEVLRQQIDTQEPLSDDEIPFTITIDTSKQVDFRLYAKSLHAVFTAESIHRQNEAN